MKNTTHDVVHLGVETMPMLETLGIRILPADGYSETDLDDNILWRSIGEIAVHTSTGVIEIRPHHDAREVDLDVLRGEAARAFHQPPSEQDEWGRFDHNNEIVWRTLIYTRHQ